MGLSAKRVLLGITGGIAAYKCPDLVRRLRETGAEVQVVMTAGAQHFVTPLTLQAVSARPVRTELWDSHAESGMGHIELARWAELVLVAPATAGFLARLAHGHADDLLTTLCLATQSPITVVPAMNWVMWGNAVTQDNVRRLRERVGRMLGPGEIVAALAERALPLAGVRVLLTAGPTRELIDPVRYVSNRSSGKTGFAVARAAAEAGAQVTLVSGPTHLPTPRDVRRVDVETAAQMHEAVMEQVAAADIFIAAAAVSDYAPAKAASQKIKKRQATLQLKLARTPDILAAVAARKHRPFSVGFAAETQNLEANARAKLQNKHLDLIVANWVGRGRGFDTDDNALSVYWKGGGAELGHGPKLELARKLMQLIAERYRPRK